MSWSSADNTIAYLKHLKKQSEILRPVSVLLGTARPPEYSYPTPYRYPPWRFDDKCKREGAYWYRPPTPNFTWAWCDTRVSYLRTGFPDIKERMYLHNLPQNSPGWQGERPRWAGASEEPKLQDLDTHGSVADYFDFKHGIYEFNQEPKLEFAVGHLMEDTSGATFSKVAKEIWKLDPFELEFPGVIADLERPRRWASIDGVPYDPTERCHLPWSFIESWDPEWDCEWVLSEKEMELPGIPINDTLLELKTGVFDPEVLKIEKVAIPEQEHVSQVQSQIRTCQTNKDWPEYSRKRYSFLSKLQPPFRHHDPRAESMSITALGASSTTDRYSPALGVNGDRNFYPLWWTHIWLIREDASYWERALPREKYFMAEYDRRAGTKFVGYNDERFVYPASLPPPEIPKAIYLGSYAFKGPHKDIRMDMNTKVARPGGQVEPITIDQLTIDPAYSSGRHFIDTFKCY